MGICGVDVLQCGDVVNKISACSVVVISNSATCDVCVFHVALFGKMKLFVVLGFFDLPFSDLNFAHQLR